MEEKASKRESRERKEAKAQLKKEKREARRAATTTTSPKDADEVQDGSSSSDDGEKNSNKKRKREAAEGDELEIDVNLPEPLSKKELRKAKKKKSDPTPNTNTNAEGHATNGDRTATDLAKAPSPYGIWIGNLPWTITKPMLADFFVKNAAEHAIPNISITRIHLPPPLNARPDKAGIKPVNKGFAYVDFASEAVLQAALAMSETPFGGRRVLIKEAKNFTGRPEKDITQGTDAPSGSQSTPGAGPGQPGKVTRRIFVGNLGFDATKEDLEKHYATCGSVVDIHMATFEDTGKCKGFAWVTFEETSAAEAAVRGWVRVNEDDDHDDRENVEDADANSSEEDGTKIRKEKKPKTRKWFVNRLLGRQLRCEFAEDASTRYKKRFGKDGTNARRDGGNDSSPRTTAGKGDANLSSKDKRRAEKAAALGSHSTSAYGGNDGEKRYRTGGIAPAEGKKITFE